MSDVDMAICYATMAVRSHTNKQAVPILLDMKQRHALFIAEILIELTCVPPCLFVTERAATYIYNLSNAR